MRILSNITRKYYNTKQGVKNCILFFPVVWRWVSWDWTGLAEFIELCAGEMRKDAELGMHTSSDRCARQLLIVQTLARRLVNDDYFKAAGYDRKTWKYLPDYKQRQIAEHSHYMAKQDAVYLGKMLRFIQHWWE